MNKKTPKKHKFDTSKCQFCLKKDTCLKLKIQNDCVTVTKK